MGYPSPEIYNAPTLLSLICFMSAMAFVVASYHWLWQAMKTPESIRTSFVANIWRRQLLSFIFVMIISIFIGVYDFYNSMRPINIIGEIIILGLALIFSYISARKHGSYHLILRYIRNVILFGGACLLGWAITIGFGFVLASFLKIVSVINRSDLDVIVIFIAGLMWNAPIIWMFSKILKNPETRKQLNGRGINKFLWSIMVAYMVLLLPLMMQEIANSDKWHEMKNTKTIRRA